MTNRTPNKTTLKERLENEHRAFLTLGDDDDSTPYVIERPNGTRFAVKPTGLKPLGGPEIEAEEASADAPDPEAEEAGADEDPDLYHLAGKHNQRTHAGGSGGRPGATAPAGAATGGARREASAAARAEARAVRARAEAAEPAMTRTIRAAAQEAGGGLAGEEHRLKTVDSLASKIEYAADKFNMPIELAAVDVTDSLRYTVVLPPAEFAAGAKKTQAALQDDGLEFYDHRSTNYIGGDGPYRGYNTVMWNPSTGVRVEIQYHTPASLKIKESNHRLYERMRSSGDDKERSRLAQEMRAAWETPEYVRPPGYATLPGERPGW